MLTLAISSVLAVSAAPANALTVVPTASFKVVMLGNGHGHGLSQYGARGAALAGLTAGQIVAFYYPGTTLVQAGPARIRVKLSGFGSALSVAPASDLTVTGIADPLPTAGIRRYRLIPGPGTGLWLQARASTPGSSWTLVKAGLANGAAFHRSGSDAVHTFYQDGTSADYFGFLAAFRSTASGFGGALTVVNRVSLDDYTAGVVPSEMPTSWPRAAVNAQAIAARTYGSYAMAFPQSRRYDICDSSMCQVYGGHAQYDSGGRLTWSDYPRAATATSDQVLEYKGAAVFSQFSASNGGWTVSGGQPYLTSKQDPYDNEASGDPYLNYRKTVPVAGVANYFGLATVTKIAVTKRDGNGTWNGRVVAGYVAGRNRSGTAVRIAATGYDFAAAFGIGTTWFALRSS